eukprot:TRINITY_DN3061_c0_g1_i1.p1 TRINITY_DN3061_c0_g1~~TRINITY_DN3061_c0_g1_i1.p1  ORF type:complete len:524 (+),score=118.43 TRINITY_DN3061_c0_g1_i1:170-1573(+)
MPLPAVSGVTLPDGARPPPEATDGQTTPVTAVDVVAEVTRAHGGLLAEVFCVAFAPLSAAPSKALSDVVVHHLLALNHWLNGVPTDVVLTAEEMARVLRVCVLPFTPWRPSRPLLAVRRAAVPTLASIVMRRHLLRTCRAAASPPPPPLSDAALSPSLAPLDVDGSSCELADGTLDATQAGTWSLPEEVADILDPADVGNAPPAVATQRPADLAEPPLRPQATGGAALADEDDDAVDADAALPVPLRAAVEAVAAAMDSDEVGLRIVAVRAAIPLCELPVRSAVVMAPVVQGLMDRLDDNNDAVRTEAANVLATVYLRAARCTRCRTVLAAAAEGVDIAAACARVPLTDLRPSAPTKPGGGAAGSPAADTDEEVGPRCLPPAPHGACGACASSGGVVSAMGVSGVVGPWVGRLLLHMDDPNEAVALAAFRALCALQIALPAVVSSVAAAHRPRFRNPTLVSRLCSQS